MAVLECLKQARVTLNKDKCHFSVDRVTFLGHVIDHAGVDPDPKEVETIQLMGSPKSPSDVRRFLGMVTQLGKFTPSLAETSKPLCDLLSKKNAWCCEELQETAFQSVKQFLISSPTLSFYSPDRETLVSAAFYRSNQITCGNQCHMRHVPLPLQNRNMRKLRKRR